MPAGLAIAAGTSLIGGFLGSSAAKKAAQQQKEASQAAIKQVDYATGAAVDRGYQGLEQSNNAVKTGLESANNTIGDTRAAQAAIYGDEQAGINQYADAGTYGLSQMQKGAGTFGFNPSDLENDPGYKFQMAQGLKALQSTAAGRGMLASGANLKATLGFSQGLASNEYGNAYNRALSTYNTNQAGYQSLAAMGQTASGQRIAAGGQYGGQLTSLANLSANTNMQGANILSGTAMQGNQYIGNTLMAGAGKDADLITGMGNSAAAGTVGSANAWSSALGGVGKAATTYALKKDAE